MIIVTVCYEFERYFIEKFGSSESTLGGLKTRPVTNASSEKQIMYKNKGFNYLIEWILPPRGLQ